jgi:Chaperone for protein-folding within the ER, fungal
MLPFANYMLTTSSLPPPPLQSFFNPANNTFSYPSTAGQAYSFTDDGHWEQALYLYQSMPGKPFCVTAQLIWQHGTYTINGSNYLLLQPFDGDGMQQVSSRCTQTSQLVQPYNQVSIPLLNRHAAYPKLFFAFARTKQ